MKYSGERLFSAIMSTVLRPLGALKIVRYLIAAVAGAVVDFIVFALLIYRMDIGYLWAGVWGFVLATLANYLVSIRLVFQSGIRFSRLQELGIIYAVSGTGLVWHQLILYFCVEHRGMHVMLSKVVAVGTVFFWNYMIRRHMIFNSTAGGCQPWP